MSRQSRIAIFGGTFDPPHEAHRQCLQDIQSHFKFDKIWIVPAKFSMDKNPVASFEKRLEWVEKVFQNPAYELSRYEETSSQTIFAFEIYAHLKLQDPEASYFWILGEDQFDKLPYWKAIDDYGAELGWVVMPRGSLERKSGLFSKRLLASSCSYQWANFLKDRATVSSSEIRQNLAEKQPQNKDFKNWIPKEIRDEVVDLYEQKRESNE